MLRKESSAIYISVLLLALIFVCATPVLAGTNGVTTGPGDSGGNGQPAVSSGIPAPFNDVKESDPDLVYISYLKQRGILQGNPDGSYHPSAGLTRAEAAVVICKAAGLKPVSAAKSSFKDVAADYWGNSYISAALQSGYIKGYPDGSYRPEAKLSRAEGIALIMRMATQKDRAPRTELSDMPKDYWAGADISTALSLQMIGLSSDGHKVYPEASMSRGSLARALAILLTTDPGLYSVKLEGKLSTLKGEVSIVRGGQDKPAAENDLVYAGDIIKSGATGSVIINYPDGSSTLMDPDSEITIKTSNGRSYIKQNGSAGIAVDYLNLELKKGTLFGALATKHENEASQSQDRQNSETKTPPAEVKQSNLGLKLAARDSFNYLAAADPAEKGQPWYQTAEKKKVKIKVDMPWGVAAVRGTFVKISVNSDGSCSVACLTGSTEVNSSSNSSQIIPLTQGQSSSISEQGKPATAAAPMSSQDKQAFNLHQDWVVNTALQQDINLEAANAPPVLDIIVNLNEKQENMRQSSTEENKATAVEVVLNALKSSSIQLKSEVIENLKQQIEQIQNQVDQSTLQQLKSQVESAQGHTTGRDANNTTGSGSSGSSSSSFSDSTSSNTGFASMSYYTAGTYGPTDGATRLTLSQATINGNNITLQNTNILGNLTVNNPGAVLRNTTIGGSLLLASGIGSGDVSLNNVTVKGSTVINGGGSNSIDIKDSSLANVEVNKENVHIVAGGSSTIDNLTLNAGANLEEAAGISGNGFASVSTALSLPSGSHITLKGDFASLSLNAPGCQVELGSGSSIVNLTANAAATISGAGNIENAVIKAAGLQMEQVPANLSIASGVSSASIGGQTLTPDTLSGSTGAIAGRVVDNSGSAVAGAGVNLQGTSLSSTANSQGVFLITGVDPGSYSLEITPPTGSSYATTFESNIEVVAGKITKVSSGITMPAASKQLQLVWHTQPGGAVAGANLSPQPVLYLEDEDGQLIDSDSSSQVSLSLTSASNATLSGSQIVTLNAGVASFTNLSIDQAGSYTLTPSSSLSGVTVSASNSFNIVNALKITSSSLPAGTSGTSYTAVLTASGGTQPYSWSATGLPSGFSLNSVSGAVYGTPTSSGTYNINFAVADSGTTAQSNNAALSLSINEASYISSAAFSPTYSLYGVAQSVSLSVYAPNTVDGTSIAASLLDSGGSSQATVSGSVYSNTASLALNIPSSLAAGSYNVRVVLSGSGGSPDSTYNAGVYTVKALASLTLSGSPTLVCTGSSLSYNLNNLSLSGKDSNNQPVDLSGQTVNWSVVSGPASVSGSSLTITGSGTVVVRATINNTDSNQLSLAVLSYTAYASFSSGNTTQLQFNSSTISNSRLRITSASGDQRGSVFTKNKVSNNNYCFSTFFKFNLSSCGGNYASPTGGTNSSVTLGADGFAFIIQPNASTAKGSTGGNIGLDTTAFKNSLAIEFDTYYNSNYGDPDDNHIAVDYLGNWKHSGNGPVCSIKNINSTFDLKDGSTYSAWIDYDGSNLTVRLGRNTDSRSASSLVLSTAVDLSTIIKTTDVYAGFAASSGGSWENHDILQWYYTNGYSPIDITQ